MSETRVTIRCVTVYCSSSNDLHASYFDAAAALGQGLATRGWNLVYGGGSVGLMGQMAASCREADGHVIGIITKRLQAAEQMDDLNHENVIVDTMRERKRLLEHRGDAFVVLPGGLGTLEEFFEILVGHLLGEHHKPIVMLNMPDPNHPGQGYYDPLIDMIDHMIKGQFAREGVKGLFSVVSTVEELFNELEQLDGTAVQVGGHLDLVPAAVEPKDETD